MVRQYQGQRGTAVVQRVRDLLRVGLIQPPARVREGEPDVGGDLGEAHDVDHLLRRHLLAVEWRFLMTCRGTLICHRALATLRDG
jgi:hypothetical protein